MEKQAKQQREEKQYIDAHSLSQLLKAGGALESQASYFEERESQIRLLKEVTNAFNNNLVGVLEAGTGVGKSFAYLLPSLLWAQKNDERVVISTGTINLQQQLFEKDIPAAQKLMSLSLKAMLIKGRQNYICRRRVKDVLQENDLTSEEIEELDELIKWLNETTTGDKASIPFMVREGLWQRVQSESDACLGIKCPFYESCFVIKLRKEANEAHILVVNHHLLFADIETRLNGLPFDENGVLPAYTRLIFDEAHGIEDSATSFFSSRLNRFVILKQLSLLARSRKNTHAGLLYTLDILSSSPEYLQECLVKMQDIKVALAEFEIACLALLSTNYTFRFTAKDAHRTHDFITGLNELHRALHSFLASFRGLIQSIDEEEHSLPNVWEAKQIYKRFEAFAELCESFLDWEKQEDFVFWIEKRRLNSGQNRGELFAKTDAVEYYPIINKTPLSIAKMMNIGVFEQFETVVCTSATLQTSSGFDLWLQRVGASLLSPQRLVCGDFPSNFNYKNNVALAIPQDIPLPDSPLFQKAIETAVEKLIGASKGRALVLFTSFESLRSAAGYLRDRHHWDYPIFVQGEADRFKLLESFKNSTDSVLLATSSFWQGVDVPGESLSHVIIVKLPFAVPTEPVFAARSEAIEKEGRSSFFELSLPGAIIAFRQGFGRLMRRNTDRGVITVLDRRVLVKSYGKQFLQSLPETKQLFYPLEDIISEIKTFLK